jgi:hypothetical protein
VPIAYGGLERKLLGLVDRGLGGSKKGGVLTVPYLLTLKRKTDRPLSNNRSAHELRFQTSHGPSHQAQDQPSSDQTRPRSRFLDDLACFERAPATTGGPNRLSYRAVIARNTRITG